MHCRVHHRAMFTTSRQTIEDERGTMTITRRRCRQCHEAAEEIRLSAGYCGPDPTRIRYAVASPVRQRQITPPAPAVGGGRHVYAAAT